LLAALTAAAATVPAAPDCPAPQIEIYLRQGDEAPGTGAAFQSFDRPNISESGSIGFAGDTDAAPGEDDVVYVNAALIAKENDPAPGIVGGRYGSFEFFETAHQVNIDGEIAFIANVTGVPGAARALYRSGTLIALQGQPAPGGGKSLYEDFGFAAATDDGTVGFLADLDGPTSQDSAVMLGDVILYREGDEVPVLESVTWDGNFDEIQWNGRGDLVFEGNTSLPGSMDMIVFRRRQTRAGVVEEIVAQEGQAVDANTGPDFLEVILQNALAENGRWGLRGNLGVAPSTADAVILTGAGFYAQQGDPVPELAGTVLGNFNGISVNSHGDVLYLADLEGPTPPGVEEGLFVSGCLLVTDGTQVPGLPAGTLFTDLGFEDLYINDSRQIVFQASYNDGSGAVEDGLFTLTLPAPCPWDLDEDGSVGIQDLLWLLAAWGSDPDGPPDFDGDGFVGIRDLLALLANWGVCS
jgi:hypothetical protein